MRALFWRAVEVAPTVVIAASDWIKIRRVGVCQLTSSNLLKRTGLHGLRGLVVYCGSVGDVLWIDTIICCW